MSHHRERKEKNCLNCGATVLGRYCQNCGQENVETKETFWSLTKHFIFDIIHFDGSFFYTLKNLVTRPGRVPVEYVQGKRQRFLHPIRMYLFTSAVFFLVFFSLGVGEIHVGNSDSASIDTLDAATRAALLKKSTNRLGDPETDSLYRRNIALLNDTTRVVRLRDIYRDTGSHFMSINGKSYKDLKTYDAIQDSLPAAKRDNWLQRRMVRQGLKLDEKYRGRTDEGANQLIEAILHRLPYMLFVSLPFVALILQLLYVRRKQFAYSDHAVFTLYLYVFTFIVLMFLFLFNYLMSLLHWIVPDIVGTLLFFGWLIFVFVGMRRFYGQGWFRTIVKLILLNILSFLLLLLLFVIFVFFSIFQL